MKIQTDLFSETNWQEMVVELLKVGSALSAEQDYRKILEMVVELAQRLTNAEGCTLYIREEGEAALNFALVRNTSLDVREDENHQGEVWKPIPLFNEKGQENHRNVSAHCALTGKIVTISDVYEAEFDFQGTREFDSITGYRSKSMLVLPLRDHEGEVIGVVQLLNAKDRETGEVTDFCDADIDIVASLASQAAIALTKRRLIDNLEKLLHAIVKMVGRAIDEKSPYTAGHIQRVAEITELFIDSINAGEDTVLPGVSFSNDQKTEFLLAAWLHDVGKIVTPEHVIDKATKLETIVDRIEIIRYRIEILKKDAAIKQLEAQNRSSVADFGEFGSLTAYYRYLDEILEFLEKINIGGEFLTDEQTQRIAEIALVTLELNGKKIALLSDDEVENLQVRRGTLNSKERDVINNHVVVSRKMLDSLPFSKKHANVSAYAGMHHERLDGKGYPLGLVKEEIPLSARALAVFDVFEALTAADRPYKLGKRMSEAMKIIECMSEEGALDADVCSYLIQSGIATRYARKYLAKRQQDQFSWQGKSYSF